MLMKENLLDTRQVTVPHFSGVDVHANNNPLSRKVDVATE
jgi:hypothetical protein